LRTGTLRRKLRIIKYHKRKTQTIFAGNVINLSLQTINIRRLDIYNNYMVQRTMKVKSSDQH